MQEVEHDLRLSEIVQQQVGLAWQQFVARLAARRNSNGAGADRAGALDVEQRVADDYDCLRPNIEAGVLATGPPGFTSDFIAIEMQVAKAAESEVVKQLKVLELDSRPVSHVSREQPQSKLIIGSKLQKQLGDARQYASLSLRQVLWQMLQIGSAKTVPVFHFLVDTVRLKQIPSDAAIGAPLQRYFGGLVDAEFLGERRFQRSPARSARVNERSVDIEKNKFHSDLAAIDGG